MATIPELYLAQHWQYRAEGNANLVLQYTGPDPRFHTTVLRLRKADRDAAALETELTTATTTKKKDLSNESLFASKVISLLLGQEFVEQLIAITFPTEFLKELTETVEPSRPETRRQKGIDASQHVGFLALDHTRFIKPSPDNAPSVAVEIKPKWGFLTKSEFILKDQSIKKRKCRFCMYQHQKREKGQENHLSEYCPINLFSGEEGLVQDALEALIRTPQNNLRLFVEGSQQAVSKESMVNALGQTSSVDLLEAGKLPTSLADVLAHILVESPLIKRLGRLQQGLDSLDIETIYKFYEQLWGVDADSIPQPTLDEFLTTAKVFLERTDLNAMMSQDQETFEYQNATSLGFGAEDDLSEVPEALKLHYLREYLLSATLKDCSILITVRREDNADEIEDGSTATRKSIDVAATGTENEKPEFKEQYHKIVVNGEVFVYKITCIDLDPKKMSSIPRQLKKDREIVSFYLRQVGDNEPSCGGAR
ncbi:Inositol-pentakisphosphate 2-kinase [Gryganskiella cystojenkinii]|nr:Inositol-pentakisphosphate 2-kinase [Gryganskiella cystojenkinii]